MTDSQEVSDKMNVIRTANSVVNRSYSRRIIGFLVVASVQIFFWPLASKMINNSFVGVDWVLQWGYVGSLLCATLLGLVPLFRGHSRLLLHFVFGLYAMFQMQNFEMQEWTLSSALGVGLIVLTGSLVFIRMTDFCFAASVVLVGLIGYPGLPWEQNPELSLSILISTNIIIFIVFGATIMNWRSSPASERTHWRLNQIEKAWKSFFMKNPTPTMIVDKFSKIHAVNPAICRYLGYSKNELLKMRVAELQLVEENTNALSQIDKGFKEKNMRVTSAGWLAKDGKLIDVSLEGSLIHSVQGDFLQLFVTDADISTSNQEPATGSKLSAA